MSENARKCPECGQQGTGPVLPPLGRDGRAQGRHGARVTIDVDKNGGVLISGEWDEIDGLAEALQTALDEDRTGEWDAGSLLTPDGVVAMRLRIEEAA